jgi:hypothetical protein
MRIDAGHSTLGTPATPHADRWALGAHLYTQDRDGLVKPMRINKLAVRHCESYGLGKNVALGPNSVALRGE